MSTFKNKCTDKMSWHIWEKSASTNSRKTIQNRVVEITLHNNVLHNNKRLIERLFKILQLVLLRVKLA